MTNTSLYAPRERERIRERGTKREKKEGRKKGQKKEGREGKEKRKMGGGNKENTKSSNILNISKEVITPNA